MNREILFKKIEMPDGGQIRAVIVDGKLVRGKIVYPTQEKADSETKYTLEPELYLAEMAH